MKQRLGGLRYLILVLTAALLLGFYSADLKATTNTKTFSVIGEYNQSNARVLADLVENWRQTGGNDLWYWNSDNTTKSYSKNCVSLTYSYDLEQIAMQRAAEYVMGNGHTRPNGSSWSTCTYNGSRSWGENLLRGNADLTPAQALECYKETDCDYAGQTHRRSLLKENYDCIGVACFHYNGYEYWAIELGYSWSDTNIGTPCAPTNANLNKRVEVSLDYAIQLTAELDSSTVVSNCFLDEGEFDLPSVKASIRMSGVSATKGLLIPPSDYDVAWTSSDTSKVKIENGKIVPLDEGTVTITATATANFKEGVSGSKSFELKVDKKSLQSAVVDNIEDQPYTGSEICPEPVVKFGDKVLVKDTDYLLSYDENIDVEDDAAVIITGIGNFKGETYKSFDIVPKDIAEIEISDPESVVYDGSSHNVSITVTYNGFELKSTDYNKSSGRYTDAGTYDIELTGKGNYTGSKTVHFTILPKPIADFKIDTINDVIYTGSPLTPSFQIKDGDMILDHENFDIVFENNTNPGTASISIDGKGNYDGHLDASFNITTRSIEDLAYEYETEHTYDEGNDIEPLVMVLYDEQPLVLGTDYDVTYDDNDVTGIGKIFVTGKGNFSGSKELTFSIIPKDLSGFEVKGVSDKTYTGSEIIQDLVVKGEFVNLKNGEDYDVIYVGNVDAGTCNYMITGKGNYEGEITGSFNILHKSVKTLTVSEIEDQVYCASQITPAIVVTYGDTTLTEGTDYTIAYDENINVGNGSVTITGINNYSEDKEVEFNIVPKRIEDFDVADIGEETYTGSKIEPKVTVTDGDYELVENTDYVLSYGDNTDAGAGSVTITGQGNYSGNITKEFTIGKKDISELTMSEISSYIYTGSAITPEVTVAYGDVILTEDTDYTISYQSNINCGEASVVATGMGNFKGTLIGNFNIDPRSINNLTVSPVDAQIYTGEAICPEITIKNGDYTLVLDEDYTVDYSDNTDKGIGRITIRGINDYAGEKIVEFDIALYTVYDLTIEEIPSVTYTGSEFTPSVVVKNGETPLVEDTDYTLSYSDNTESGTGIVTITGIGDYAGETKAEFQILGRPMSDLTITGIFSSKTFTGSGITIEPTIKYGETELSLGTDYIITYENNVNAGTASYKISGIGNYAGESEGTFKILQKSISLLALENPGSQVYTGSALTPDVVVTDGETALVLDTDFTLTYGELINAGTYKVTVSGIGNYKGSSKVDFTINPKDIRHIDAEAIEEKVFTGLAITPVPVLTYGDLTLGSDDFDCTYDDAIVIGDHTVTVTGKGNYTGSRDLAYRIVAKDISGFAISGLTDKYYTGAPIVFAVTVSDGTEILDADLDYEVVFENNTEVGTANITIHGKGDYAGTIEGTFEILKTDVENLNCENISDITYTGDAIIPNIVLKNGKSQLVDGTDYTLSATNNVDVGQVELTIEGTGNYCGTKKVNFNIVAKNATNLTVDEVEAQVFTGEALEPAVVVKDGENIVSDTQYDLSYKSNVNFGSEAEITIKFKNNYTGEKKVNFRIAGKSVKDVTMEEINSVIYNGSAYTPSAVIKDGDVTLTKDVDYEIYYSENTNAGNAVIRIKGINNYAGEKTFGFVIEPKDIKDFTLEGVGDSVTYTGSAITFALNVFDGNQDLTSSDYTVKYSNNTNIGTASLTVEGTGNYKGSISSTFTIEAKSFETVTVSSIADQPYTGDYISPNVLVKDGTKVLTEGTDYKVTFSDNKAVTNSATVKLEGKGNYEGSKTITFKIVARSVNTLSVSGISEQKYTGKAITPSVTVKYGNKTLANGTDYKLSYSNNVNAGTATVTITGMGNYTGSRNVTFTIKAPPATPSPSQAPTAAPTPRPTATPTPAVKDPMTDIRGFVDRIYRNVLGREPEEEGAAYWAGELYKFNKNGAEVANLFLQSPEFINKKTSDKEYIQILYRTFFGREADDGGLNYWMSQLSSGAMNRNDVANGFIYSLEWANTCAEYGICSGGATKPTVVIKPSSLTVSFVERMYTTAMHREYDEGGRDYWAAELANYNLTGEYVGAFFFLSDEMRGYNLSDSEFVERLYLTFMDRESDQGGKDFWLSYLKQGHSRQEVVYGFTRSPEFVEKCIEARILPY